MEKIDEKSVSKSQRRLMGYAYAVKSGKIKKAPKFIKKLAASMSLEDLRDFAKTKHKNLPERKDENIITSYELFVESIKNK